MREILGLQQKSEKSKDQAEVLYKTRQRICLHQYVARIKHYHISFRSVSGQR